MSRQDIGLSIDSLYCPAPERVTATLSNDSIGWRAARPASWGIESGKARGEPPAIRCYPSAAGDLPLAGSP